MSVQVTNYQCPSCTGPLHFAGESGKLECEYCGAQYEVKEIEKLYAAREESAEAQAAEQQEDEGSWEQDPGESWGVEDGMRAYTCPSCGAELVCDESTAATECPYCGNPSIVPGQFSGSKKPDWVLPFRISKDAAMEALKKDYKKRPLLPKYFKNDNHLREIQGVYVPFWLFDGEADVDMEIAATRSHVRETSSERITTTEHYRLYRSGRVAFEKIPVDASTRMPDAYMDGIEPFHYEDMTEFSTAYLPGYLADKYDVSVEESSKRADDRARSTASSAVLSTAIGYDTRSVTRENVRLRRGKVSYALLPVWLLNTEWHGKKYLYAVNGQTGTTAGEYPVSQGKFWGMFAGITAVLAALAALIWF